MGAGKSTLVNNLIRVLNRKTNDFDRAQVCGDAGENGTYFLNEYALCEKSNNICVFDSRGISEVATQEALTCLEDWMVHGVRHNQMVTRDCDSDKVKQAVENKGRHGHHKLSKRRSVNFVIFVVNALSVHKMYLTPQDGDHTPRDNLRRLFKFPFLSFNDARPVVVMTHGDLLKSDNDRLETRIYLGEQLGVPAVDYIFEYSAHTGRFVEEGDDCPVNDLILLEMVEFALQRADRNLPRKFSTYVAVKEWVEKVVRSCSNLNGKAALGIVVLALLVQVLFAILIMAFRSSATKS